MSDEVTEEMESALSRLTIVAPFDFAGAYRAAYAGISALDPRRSTIAANMVYGRTLAFNVWAQRQTATLDMRSQSLLLVLALEAWVALRAAR